MSETTNDELRALVDSIVSDLFCNGFGEEAARLVLTATDGRNLGGWCRLAVRDRIMTALAAAGPRDHDEQVALAEMRAAVEDGENG